MTLSKLDSAHHAFVSLSMFAVGGLPLQVHSSTALAVKIASRVPDWMYRTGAIFHAAESKTSSGCFLADGRLR
jgi:hypothetical protein